MRKVIHGDLFTTTRPAIGHGVNLKGVMGKGVAAQFKQRYPAMFTEYRAACTTGWLHGGEALLWEAPDGLIVVNLATQPVPGPTARVQWIEDALCDAFCQLHDRGISSLALPLIGCGLGGLRPHHVLPVLKARADEYDFDIDLHIVP